jgi:hypothetical protein
VPLRNGPFNTIFRQPLNVQAKFQLRARVFKINYSFAVTMPCTCCYCWFVFCFEASLPGAVRVTAVVCRSGNWSSYVLQIWCFDFRSNSLLEYVDGSALDQSPWLKGLWSELVCLIWVINSVGSPGPEIYEGSEDLQRKIRRSPKSVLLAALHRSRGDNKLPTTRMKRTGSW